MNPEAHYSLPGSLLRFGAYGGTRTHNFSLLRRTPLPIGTRKHGICIVRYLTSGCRKVSALACVNPTNNHYFTSHHSHSSFGTGFYGFPPPGFRHVSNYDVGRKIKFHLGTYHEGKVSRIPCSQFTKQSHGFKVSLATLLF